MNRRLLTAATVTITTLISFCPAQAGAPVPFQGSGIAVFANFIPPDTGVFVSSGTATHLGLWSGVALVTYVDDVPAGASLTFLAANGDILRMETFAEVDPDTGELRTLFAVTGGTGRFDGAEGSGRFDAVNNPDGTVGLSWDGELTFAE